MSKFLDTTGVQTLWGLIKERDGYARRDNYFNYNADFVPANGQICFVDTASDGLQIKVGDGITTWENLNYLVGSDILFGLTRMYSTTGSNTDGSMTQKAITEALNKKVEVSVDTANELVTFSHD